MRLDRRWRDCSEGVVDGELSLVERWALLGTR
jgi:hypothetical protein